MSFGKLNLARRAPDFVIMQGGKPYMRRWWVTERASDRHRLYLHNQVADDDDRAQHDHPARSLSVILKGGYVEHLPDGVKKIRRRGSVIFRSAEQPHRLELHRDRDGNPITSWSLFFFWPNTRQWGFHCESGWRHWRDFTGVKQGEARGDERGPGCGE